MASILKVDEMQGVASAGNITITDGTVTMKMQDGIAKATIAAAATASIYDSFNISSGEDEGVGDYKYNVTSAFSATTVEKCCSACTLGTTAVVRTKAADATASVIDIETMNSSFDQADANHALAVHGDLA